MQVSQMKRAVSQAQWKQRIVECRNSGVPVKEWCRKQEISYSYAINNLSARNQLH